MLELLSRFGYERFGYERFGVLGSDTGAIVGTAMGREAPDRVPGVRGNACITFPMGEEGTWTGSAPTIGADTTRWDCRRRLPTVHTKPPHTLTFGLHDSRVAQLPWIAEMDHRWADTPADVPPRRRSRALHLQVRTPASFGGAKEFAAGIELAAVDDDLAIGHGPQVRGPALSLLLAATGRAVALADLEGPGLAVVAEAIG